MASDGVWQRGRFLAELITRLGGEPEEMRDGPMAAAVGGVLLRVNMPDAFGARAVAMVAEKLGCKVTLEAPVPSQSGGYTRLVQLVIVIEGRGMSREIPAALIEELTGIPPTPVAGQIEGVSPRALPRD